MQSAFDKTDFLGRNEVVALELYKTASGPRLDPADKFGILRVEATSRCSCKVEDFPHNFIILEIDGDLVHGEMEVEFVMPEASESATARMLQKSGSSLIMGVNNAGGLPDCRHSNIKQTSHTTRDLSPHTQSATRSPTQRMSATDQAVIFVRCITNKHVE